MNEYFVDLTDGTRLEVKVNFGTLYYLGKINSFKQMEKVAKKKEPTDEEAIEIAAQIIYAVIRSNGRAVTFDEAIRLVPMDLEGMQNILDAFGEQLEEYKKKERAKSNMRNAWILTGPSIWSRQWRWE